MDELDDVIIGAGQSGPFLAHALATSGRRVALVEKRWLGGTCVNDGCMPTKTLVACARAAFVTKNAARWGVLVRGDVQIDWRAVQERKNAVVMEARHGLETWLGGTKGLEVIQGVAAFVDASTVAVGDRRLRAKRFFLNTGARPVVPEIPGIHDVPYLTSESVMDLPALPRHLVILGGSNISLELGHVFRRFGSEVTIVERAPRVMSREDPEVSAVLLDVLAREGIAFELGARAEKVALHAEGIELTTDRGTVIGSHLLLATGRAPATQSLALERAGVALDARGYIQVDDELRTTVPHIYALGDVNGHGAFTHTSYDDFRIVSGNLLRGERRRVSHRIPIHALYVDPPLGRCGMNLAEARASGKKVLVGTRPMTRVGRARERGETDGFIQILVDADTRRILGGTILGIEGDEAIHSIVDIMYAGATCDVLMGAVHTHPTVSELLPTVIESLKPLD